MEEGGFTVEFDQSTNLPGSEYLSLQLDCNLGITFLENSI